MASSRGKPDRTAYGDLPLVLVNSAASRLGAGLHSVAVDDRGGARMAVEHLLSLGHRRIGYLGAASRAASNLRRRRGYLDALAAVGLTPDAALVVDADALDAEPDADFSAGRALAPLLLERGASALFCYNDMIAVGALRACRDRRVQVPEQCSIVGFDDVALSRYCDPELTTVRQPRTLLGETAMRLLLDRLSGRTVRRRMIVPEFVVRASTAPFIYGSVLRRNS